MWNLSNKCVIVDYMDGEICVVYYPVKSYGNVRVEEVPSEFQAGN